MLDVKVTGTIDAPDTKDIFDETYWHMSFGQSLGYNYVAKFSADGTFVARGMGSGAYEDGTYTYTNGKLVIVFDIDGFGYPSTIEYSGNKDGFTSLDKYPMQVGEDFYWISPDDGMSSYFNEGLSCGTQNGCIVSLDNASVTSYFSDQNVSFSLDSGKRVECSIIKLHQSVRNCTSIAVNLEITELRAGNVQGEWGFYVRDLNGTWHLADTFELNGNSTRAVIVFDEPMDFDAWACPCHVLGNYWDFNFSVWLEDANVFQSDE